MKYKTIKLNVLLILGLVSTSLYAQETIPASGSNASGSGGTTSYTVGQTVYTTQAGVNGSEAAGIQQPYEVSVVLALDQTDHISLNYEVYPNPATDFLKLDVKNSSIENLSYMLYDVNGNLLENKKIENRETGVSMSEHTPAAYFLKIYNNNKEVKTFKIIKN